MRLARYYYALLSASLTLVPPAFADTDSAANNLPNAINWHACYSDENPAFYAQRLRCR